MGCSFLKVHEELIERTCELHPHYMRHEMTSYIVHMKCGVSYWYVVTKNWCIDSTYGLIHEVDVPK
jgi:hypothetical protein